VCRDSSIESQPTFNPRREAGVDADRSSIIVAVLLGRAYSSRISPTTSSRSSSVTMLAA
jgi:hypothetical protein